MQTSKPKLLVGLMAVALAACATSGARRATAPEMDYSAYAGPEQADLFYFRLDSWEVVGRDQLILWTGMREAYLLKVWEPCSELQYAQAIAFTSQLNRLSRFDKVLAGRDSCPIASIRKLDAVRLKADRLKARRP